MIPSFLLWFSCCHVFGLCCCRRQPVFVALSDFADVLLTFCEIAVSFVRHSEPITSTIFFRKSSDCLEETTYWRSDVLLTFWKMAATSKILYAARSNNTGRRWSLMCSITYSEYISTRQSRWLLLWIDAINDHRGGAATLSRLDLVGFDNNGTHSFPVISEYSNMEPWTWSTYILQITWSG